MIGANPDGVAVLIRTAIADDLAFRLSVNRPWAESVTRGFLVCKYCMFTKPAPSKHALAIYESEDFGHSTRCLWLCATDYVRRYLIGDRHERSWMR